MVLKDLSVSVDPAISVDLGNSGVGSVDGDFVGMYSANLTGGVKVNYPWPLHNGPELGFDLSAKFNQTRLKKKDDKIVTCLQE